MSERRGKQKGVEGDVLTATVAAAAECSATVAAMAECREKQVVAMAAAMAADRGYIGRQDKASTVT